MRVLIACEESQEVCKAFRALGHPYCGPVKIVYSDRTEGQNGQQNQD